MKKFIYCLMAAAMVASCNDSDIFNGIAEKKEITLQASMEQNEGARASFENSALSWSAGDKIAALLSDGSYFELTLDGNSVGQPSGVFKGAILSSATIAEEGFHAYYPACIAVTATTVTLPKSYDVEDDFANSNALMKAVGTGSLTFKHLGGILKFKLNNVPAGSSSVRFTTLDDKNITGTFTIGNDGENETVVATEGDGTNSSISISFKPLAAASNIEVSFPLPIGEYTGIKLEVFDAENNYTVKPIEAPAAKNTITRALRLTMPDVTFVAIEAGGEGAKISDGVYQTAENEYTITNAAGLFWVANQVNTQTNNFGNKVIKLANNIDLQNAEWTPIGLSTGYGPEFAGTFDGNHKTISNLNVTDIRTDKAAAGFIGYATLEHLSAGSTGGIRNLTIDNATVVSTHYAGAVVAWAQGGFKVEGCNVTNSTITTAPEIVNEKYDNGDKAGGVVGYIAQKGTTITGCSVSNTTVTGYRDLGGICGYVNSLTIFTDNTVGSGVKIVQDFTNSYKNVPSKVSTVGAVYGSSAAATESGNSGSAQIIVKVYDTATAQLALDAAVTGRTIEFAAGTYENLVLRHTKVTTQIDGTNKYHRTVYDLTLKAATGANVTINGFDINAGHVYTANASNPAKNYVVDEAGVDIQSTNVYNYYAYFDIKNFVFDGFNLTKHFYIGADSSSETDKLMQIDGFTMQNCSMTGSDEAWSKENSGCRLIRIGGSFPTNGQPANRFLNVKILNCTATHTFQGVYAYGPVDYYVGGCTFDNLYHNVFQVGAGKSTFSGNTIKNCNTDRLFRIGDNFPTDDWVKILNNIITNSTGDANDANPYYKTNTPGVNIEFTGNTMDGKPWSPLN